MAPFALALLLAAPDANLSLLRPASGSDGFLGLEGVRPELDPELPLELQLGLDGSYLPVRPRGSRIETRLGGWAQLFTRLEGSLSLFAQLPVTVRESGEVSSGFGVGDIRLGVRHGFTPRLAGQLAVEVDTARAGTLSGDGRSSIEALVSASDRRGSFELLGNAFLRLRPPRDVASALLGNELGLRLGAALPLGPRARAYGELELQASLRQVSQQSWPLEWRAGGRICASDALALDAALGTRLDDGLGAPSLRGVVALRYAPLSCRRTEPKGPEPGMAELAAQLAQARAAREAQERESAVLELLPRSEADARGAAAMAEAIDLLDASEADARARAAAFAEDDVRDSDGDGVPDRIDNCPHEKGPARNHGCPLSRRQVVVLREDRIEILEKVQFASGKARIEKRSFRLLDQVARVLSQHPDLLQVEVAGHTDTRGSVQLNTALSQARAESVVKYLARHGVAAGRLTAKGYGPARPLAPNTSPAGREKNRRVEFQILRRRVASQVIEVPQ